MKTITVDHFDVYVGENATENWELIDKYIEYKYTWFHLASFPSCHVFVDTKYINPQTIYMIANVCKQNTKFRNIKHLEKLNTLL